MSGWEWFTQWLTNVSNNPVFISLTSILAGLGSILVIIGRTSIGRKSLEKLTLLGNKTVSRVDGLANTIEEKIKSVDSKVKQLKEEKEKFISDLENKYKIFYNQFEFYETQLIKVLELIPNAKVQAEVKVLTESWNEKKKEIEEYIGISYTEYKNKLSDLEKEIEELKNGRNDNCSEEE